MNDSCSWKLKLINELWSKQIFICSKYHSEIYLFMDFMSKIDPALWVYYITSYKIWTLNIFWYGFNQVGWRNHSVNFFTRNLINKYPLLVFNMNFLTWKITFFHFILLKTIQKNVLSWRSSAWFFCCLLAFFTVAKEKLLLMFIQ